MEFLIPFYIAPSTPGVGAVVNLRPGADAIAIDRPSLAELVVVSGGPVFLWQGEKTVDSAYAATHGATPPDFDLAASIYSGGVILLSAGFGMLTLASDNESIGYLGFYESIRRGRDHTPTLGRTATASRRAV